MYSFKNDYSEGAHPAILESLVKNNFCQQPGYGLDEFTKRAIDKLKTYVNNSDIDIHLISGGTQTNLIAISSFLRPHEACIAVESGHIAVHETGAIEATGHKIITVPPVDGKITIQNIEKALNIHEDEHMVKPGMVYISNPTELGTVYTASELEKIYAYCQSKGLYLYADGARLGTAIMYEEANLTLEIMGKFTDAFFIGATKNGALLGEALIISHPMLKSDMRYLIKQKGALMAKGRLLGIQFDTLFEDNLFFDLAKHANNMAQKLKNGLLETGHKFLLDSPTNQIFPIFSEEEIALLQKQFDFYIWEKVDENHSAIRLVTSWATKEENVQAFLNLLKKA